MKKIIGILICTLLLIPVLTMTATANSPPNKPTITGPTNGKAGVEYEYTFVTTDPDGDNVNYIIDWCSCGDTVTVGPYTSGGEVKLSHIWSEQGTYTIIAKAKDINEAESNWVTLEVTMPKNKRIVNDNSPPNPPDITGPLSGKIEETYIYYFTVTDPDEDDFLLELEVDFGDGLIVERCGCDIPWNNGETVEIEHKWKTSGNYEITARVMDVYGEWSEWSEPLSVTMPRNKAIQFNSFFQEFLEQHPRMFPILRQMLGM